MDPKKKSALLDLVNHLINESQELQQVNNMTQLKDGKVFQHILSLIYNETDVPDFARDSNRISYILHKLKDLQNDLDFDDAKVNAGEQFEISKVLCALLLCSFRSERADTFVTNILQLNTEAQQNLMEITKFVLDQEDSLSSIHRFLAKETHPAPAYIDIGLQSPIPGFASPARDVMMSPQAVQQRALVTQAKLQCKLKKVENQLKAQNLLSNDLDEELQLKIKYIQELELIVKEIHLLKVKNKSLSDEVQESAALQDNVLMQEKLISKLKEELATEKSKNSLRFIDSPNKMLSHGSTAQDDALLLRNKDLHERVESLRQELCKNNEEANKTKQGYMQLVKDLEVKYSTATDEIAALHIEIKSLEKKKEEEKCGGENIGEYMKQEEMISDLEKLLEEAQSKLLHNEKELKSIERRSQTNEEKYEHLKKEHLSLHNENETLNKKIEEQSMSHESTIDVMKRKELELKKKLSELTHSLHCMEEEKTRIEDEQSKTSNDTLSIKREFLDKEGTLRKEIFKLREERHKAELELLHNNSTLESQSLKLEQQATYKDELQTANSKLHHLEFDYQQEIKDKLSVVLKLERSEKELIQEKLEHKQLLVKCETMSEESNNLQNNLSKTVAELTMKDKELAERNQQIEKLHEEKIKIIEQLKENNIDTDKVNDEKEDLITANQRLNNEVLSLGELYDKETATSAGYNLKVEQLQMDLKQACNTINNLETKQGNIICGKCKMHESTDTVSIDSSTLLIRDKSPSTYSMQSYSSGDSISLRSDNSQRSIASSSVRRTRRKSALYMTGRTPTDKRTSMSVPTCQLTLMESSDEADYFYDWDRVAELKRRNTLLAPHLRSSYSVELDNKLDTKINAQQIQAAAIAQRKRKLAQRSDSTKSTKEVLKTASTSNLALLHDKLSNSQANLRNDQSKKENEGKQGSIAFEITFNEDPPAKKKKQPLIKKPLMTKNLPEKNIEVPSTPRTRFASKTKKEDNTPNLSTPMTSNQNNDSSFMKSLSRRKSLRKSLRKSFSGAKSSLRVKTQRS